MIWLKRRFAYADFAPYQDRLGQLQLANASQYREFMMVSRKEGAPGESDYYVSLPNDTFERLFDGFVRVADAELPREINTILLADTTCDEYTSRFTFKRVE